MDKSYEKAVPPTQKAVILGYEVDSRSMTVGILSGKTEKIMAICETFAGLTFARLRELQQLIENLVFAARVIRGGWIFLSRMLALLRVKGRGQNPLIGLTKAFQANLRWWKTFFRGWQGLAVVPTFREIHVFVDSCSYSWGVWWEDHWAAGLWSHKICQHHINWKELATIKLAAAKWAKLWSGARVFVHCDNCAAVAICTRGASRSAPLAKIMREIFWLISRENCELSVLHIPGKQNIVADALSRSGADGWAKRL